MRPIQTNDPEKLYQPAKGTMYHMFPTPFFHGKTNLNLQQVKSDMDRLIDVAKHKQGDDDLMNYTTYFDAELREETYNLPWYESFANQMKDTYIEFISSQYDLQVDHLNRHDIHLFTWLNRYDTEHSHAVHDHVNSKVSGTLYIDVDEDSTPIRYINPNHNSVFSHGTMNKEVSLDEQIVTQGAESGASQVEMAFFPRNGDFMLWPSYVLHYVPKTQLKDKKYTRYSISFNLGHSERYNDTEHGKNMSYSFLGDNE